MFDQTLTRTSSEDLDQLTEDLATVERTVIEPLAIRAYHALRDAGTLLTDDADVEPGSPQDRLSDLIVECLAHFEAARGFPDVAAPAWWARETGTG